jgi:L-threonylcarbamoyladenylate synthase
MPAQVRILDVARAADREASLAAAVAAIDAGGIVAVPTETVYGITARLDEQGLDALLEAKARPAEKGITLLVDSLAQVERLADVDERARRLADRFWPGPLTLVLPARPDARLPRSLTGSGGTVGVRIPDHPVPRALAQALGPLPLTSANRSGEADSRSAPEVVAALGDALALVLDGGPSAGGTPSTVVLLPSGGDVDFGRIGAIPREAIEAALETR